jgi:hypothetical protein
MADELTENAEPVGYTKGPWISRGEVRSVGDQNNSSMLWCGAVTPAGSKWRGDVAHIQSCDHVPGFITREEAAANARLIAAAPDMLEALRRIANAVEINAADMGAVLAAIANADPEWVTDASGLIDTNTITGVMRA